LLLVPRYGVPGAGWATALALGVQCALLLGGLRALGVVAAPLRVRDLPGVLAPGVAAWAAAWGTRVGLVHAGVGDGAVVTLAIAAGVAAAAVACAWLRPADFAELTGALARRFKRR
jgi:hypothetical protein